MKRTKIVATIGPTSDSEEILRTLFQEGLDVCRLNFSHGSQEEHKVRIDRIKKIREELDLPIGIMLDTKGPEIRLGQFKDDKSVELKAEHQFILTVRDVLGDENIASVSYGDLARDMEVGAKILIDDGLVGLEVVDIQDTEIICTVLNGGMISGRKGVNVPDTNLTLPALTEKDISDIQFGLDQGIDFIAASFVRNREDVLGIRRVLEDYGDFNTMIISKIESTGGMENIDEIIETSDGIMVARGDLGVEIETEEVPLAQKEIIRKCNIAGKAVITATQMLDSMIRNPRPTRAEANDVANAVLDGTSAVMLSGETANGKYPLEAVQTMRKIVEVTEKSIDYRELLRKRIEEISNTTTNAIGKSTCTIAQDLNARAIITATTSGFTTRAISKFRPKCDIIAATTSKRVRRQLNLEWGVDSVLVDKFEDTDKMIEGSLQESINKQLVDSGDKVILTAGVPVGLAGSTNLIKVETISEIVGKGIGFGDSSVTARAVVANSEEDLVANFNDGDIIITRSTDKEMVKFMERASAIITEEAGYTSHGAVTGVSLGKPTVVGVKNITEKINIGDLITVNAEDGTIRKGTIGE